MRKWEWDGEVLEVPGRYLMRKVGEDLIDGEGRLVHKILILMDGEEEVVGYDRDPGMPGAKPLYALQYDIWEGVVEVEFRDGSSIEFKSFRGFLDWVRTEWGKEVERKIRDVLEGIVEEINEEEAYYASEEGLYYESKVRDKEKMRSGNMLVEVVKAIISRRNMKEQWEELPAGWDRESLKKFWNSLTGGLKPGEGGVTECIAAMEGKVDDPGAFCGSLADKLFGKEWRSKAAKERRRK